jgi:hypothetical protein
MSVNGTSYGGSVTQDQLVQSQATNAGLSYESAPFDLVGGTTVLIGTTEANLGRFRIQHRAVTCLTVDTFATPAVITIGTNAPDYDNIYSWTLTNLDTVNEFLQGTLSGVLTIAPNTAIYVKLATPAGATAMTVLVELEGSYQGA